MTPGLEVGLGFLGAAVSLEIRAVNSWNSDRVMENRFGRAG